MFRPRCGLRQKLVCAILAAILLFSWVLGTFPFVYQSKAHRLRRSKWLVLYGIGLSSCLLHLLLQQNGAAHGEDPLEEVFQRNFVLLQLSLLLAFVGILTIITMYARTFRRSGDLESIYNELLRLELEHFDTSTAECPVFDGYVVRKGLLVACGLSTTLLVHFGMSDHPLPLVNALVVVFLKLGTFLMAIHFHLGVAIIYRFLYLNNQEFLDLANPLSVALPGSVQRLRLIVKVHKQLVDLYGKLSDCYDYQTALMMIVFLAANINVVFYMIVYGISLGKMSFFVMLIMFPLALLNNFFDFWLTIAVCDLVERTGGETSRTLRLFNDIPDLDKRVERLISSFSLFCCHRKFKFQHCGLFYLNREMGFQMLVTSFLYLLFLVQFDFMNL
ncbi:hypothetical protein KR018_002743 [Drosophila ironensis]|nr:hypothetical protein KR018_002743 [Drosophila ironensis]